MMFRFPLTLSCLLGLLAAASGCGNASDPKSGITVEHAAPTAEALTQVPEQAANYFALPGYLATSSCLTTSGLGTDVDGDGLADAGNYVADCTTALGTHSIRVTGSVAVVDQNLAGATFQFMATYDLLALATDSSSTEVARSQLDLVTFATQSGNILSIRTQGTEQTTFSDGQPALTQSHGWNATYTSQGSGTAGEPLANGTLALVGAWSTTLDGRAYATTLTGSVDIDMGCGAGAVVGGTLTAGEAGNTDTFTRLVATWTGCGQVAATVDGEAVDIDGTILPTFAF